MNSSKELDLDKLNSVSGGQKLANAIRTGAPIMRKCSVCGKEFQAGIGGVNHAKYPLETMCSNCKAKQKV